MRPSTETLWANQDQHQGDRLRLFAAVSGLNGVDEIVSRNKTYRQSHLVEFIADDYRGELGLAEQDFDLLVSLYAGFVSEHCTRYLRVGGHLLVNASHGDAAMASIDRRYRLAAVIKSGGPNGYRVDVRDLDAYLIPNQPQALTADRLHQLGRGIGYTKSPFAYLFERIS